LTFSPSILEKNIKPDISSMQHEPYEIEDCEMKEGENEETKEDQAQMIIDTSSK
jgi:hypothetical protein